MVGDRMLDRDEIRRPVETLGAQPGIGELFLAMGGDELVHESAVLPGGGGRKRQRDRAEIEFEQAIALAGLVIVVALRNGAGDWVAVGKRRQKGTFATREDRIERVQREEQAGQGCSLEIAEVSAEARAWWSVSFEAFGSYDQAALIDYLRRAAHHVFAEAPPFALSAERSMSYPTWLWSLAHGEAASGES